MFSEVLKEITFELDEKDHVSNEEIASSLERFQIEKRIELKSEIEEIKNGLQLMDETNLVGKIQKEYQIKLMEEQLDALTPSKKDEYIMDKLENFNKERKLTLIKKIGDVLYDKKQELTNILLNKEQELEVMKQKLYNEAIGLNSQNVVLNTTAEINELSNYVSYNKKLIDKVNRLYEDNLYGISVLDISSVTSADLDIILFSYKKKLAQIKEYKKVNKKQKNDKKVIKVKAHIKNSHFDKEETTIQKLIGDAILNNKISYLKDAEELIDKSKLDTETKNELKSSMDKAKEKIVINNYDKIAYKIEKQIDTDDYNDEILDKIDALKNMYYMISGNPTISENKIKEYKNTLNGIIFKYNKCIQDGFKAKVVEDNNEKVQKAIDDGKQPVKLGAEEKTSVKDIIKLSTKRFFGKIRKNKNVDFTNTPMVLIKKNYIAKIKYNLFTNNLSELKEKEYNKAKNVIAKNLIKGTRKNKEYSKALCDKYIELIKIIPKYVTYRFKEYDMSKVMHSAMKCFNEAMYNGSITEDECNNYVNLANDICLYRSTNDCYELFVDNKIVPYVDMEHEELMKMRQIVGIYEKSNK